MILLYPAAILAIFIGLSSNLAKQVQYQISTEITTRTNGQVNNNLPTERTANETTSN